MNTLIHPHRNPLYQPVGRLPFQLDILGTTLSVLLLLMVTAGRADWNDRALTSNMQAVVVSCATNDGIGAGLRIEDVLQGSNSVVAGLAWMEPSRQLQTGDRFRIASCSKTFTAVAIFLLKEQALLKFDQPIVRYLPQFKIPGSDIITIRHLLTHTSGLPDHNNQSDVLFAELAENPLTYFAPTQICELISSMPNNFAPGEKWKYCDTGFYLLHLIIENVNTNGWTYQQYVERKLIQPSPAVGPYHYQHPNTFVPGPDNNYLSTIPGDHAHGYMPDQAGWADVTELNQSFDVGCGGMVSSL
jgi:CubicO group peptidase (beta-lactamase class C family)